MGARAYFRETRLIVTTMKPESHWERGRPVNPIGKFSLSALEFRVSSIYSVLLFVFRSSWACEFSGKFRMERVIIEGWGSFEVSRGNESAPSAGARWNCSAVDDLLGE